MGTKQRAERPGLPLLVRVRRALFVSADRWPAVAGQWSRPFRRQVRPELGQLVEEWVDEDQYNARWALQDVFVVGRLVYLPGLPVKVPLSFNRLTDVYRVKAASVEGDALLVHLA